jgi:hypothetical protein
MAFVAAAIALVAGCGEPKPSNAAILQQDLAQLRKAIRQFQVQQHRAPATLKELVPKYLPAIPIDPVTGAGDWHVVTEQSVAVTDFRGAPPPSTAPAIVDVRSSAPGTDTNGKPWSEY